MQGRIITRPTVAEWLTRQYRARRFSPRSSTSDGRFNAELAVGIAA